MCALGLRPSMFHVEEVFCEDFSPLLWPKILAEGVPVLSPAAVQFLVASGHVGELLLCQDGMLLFCQETATATAILIASTDLTIAYVYVTFFFFFMYIKFSNCPYCYRLTERPYGKLRHDCLLTC